MLGRQTEFTEAVGAPGQVVPKRPAGLSVSPITRSEIKLDMNVDESGPVRANEFDPERVDEFGPTSADEDVVQEANLPSKAELESDNVSDSPFWFGALRVSGAEDFHLVIAKLTRRRQNRHRFRGLRVLWATGRRST